MDEEEITQALGRKPLTFEQMKEIQQMQLQHDWEALRNQAAIAAMQGLICNEEYSRSEDKLAIKAGKPHLIYSNTAINAVLYADALIKELKKK